ncbi:J domain-containing protein [Oryzibacter oryziterrae]|uniref:J domain-containing protein n=1 Tax=Oryzibacter oryziterrae TaxID=2766474 RepID=UPI001F483AE4|nr:J domain-containing protein [Oryzibacter oryziterrae]
MESFSKLFDKIRVKPDKEQAARESHPRCEWAGCENAGAYRAPKGRGREGQFHHFCLEHVQLYNKSYNYFSGMGDDAVAAYQKDALTGHRPTWNVSVNKWGQTDPNAGRSKRPEEPAYNDPFGVFHGSRAGGAGRVEEPKRRVSPMTQRAFDTLHLDVGASKDDIKAQYKTMVKRHHPDANGGDRSSEERLREIIQAYNYLKTAGFV